MRRRNGDAFEIGQEQLVDERAVTLEVPAGSLAASPASEPRTVANGVEGPTGEAESRAESTARPRRSRDRRRHGAAARAAFAAFAVGVAAVVLTSVVKLGSKPDVPPTPISVPRRAAPVGSASTALGSGRATRDGESRSRGSRDKSSRVGALGPAPAPTEAAPPASPPVEPCAATLAGPPASSPATGWNPSASSPPADAANADRAVVTQEFGP